jgi:hypothetical protein
MKSDNEIERDVKAELEWDPDLDASDIAVSVKSGVVTLAGFVKSYTEKEHAKLSAPHDWFNAARRRIVWCLIIHQHQPSTRSIARSATRLRRNAHDVGCSNARRWEQSVSRLRAPSSVPAKRAPT